MFRFPNGYVTIYDKDTTLYNIQRIDDSLVFDEWLLWIEVPIKPEQECIIIRNKGGFYNVLNMNCQLLCNTWMYYASVLDNNRVRIQRIDYLWNIIDTNGNILYKDEWLANVYSKAIYLDYFIIKNNNNQYNIIDKYGRLQSPKLWFDSIVIKRGYAIGCQCNHFGYKILLYDGQIHFSKEFYRDYVPLSAGYIKVQRQDGLWNIVDNNGKFIIPNGWALFIDQIHNDIVRCHYSEDKWNYCNVKTGKHILMEKVKYCTSFENDYGCIQREDGMWNFVDCKGKLLSPKIWFTSASQFNSDGYAIVWRNMGGYNYINKQGNILCPQISFLNITYNRIKQNFIVKRTDGMINIMDIYGNILFPYAWFDSIRNGYLYLDGNAYYFDDNNRLHKKVL